MFSSVLHVCPSATSAKKRVRVLHAWAQHFTKLFFPQTVLHSRGQKQTGRRRNNEDCLLLAPAQEAAGSVISSGYTSQFPSDEAS